MTCLSRLGGVLCILERPYHANKKEGRALVEKLCRYVGMERRWREERREGCIEKVKWKEGKGGRDGEGGMQEGDRGVRERRATSVLV